MRRESLLFIEPAPGQLAAGALLLPPNGSVFLESASGAVRYLDAIDFIVDRAHGRVTLTPESRIPTTSIAELRLSIDPDGSGFLRVRGDAHTFLFASDDGFFHERQVLASYPFDRARWTGWTPAFAGHTLPRTIDRLRRREPLTMCVVGDSISEGYSASGFIGRPPYQAPYAGLVAAELERVYRSPITLRNLAVAGSTADHGVHLIDAAIAERPDLVIVAFGMNDAGYADPPDYAAHLRMIVDTLRHSVPRVEIVLVSSMLPHPDWAYPLMARFAGYRDALTALCGQGVALADVTTLWGDLMTRKTPYDLTGNGLNHPNDFGHRLYADVLLSLLIE